MLLSVNNGNNITDF